MASRKRPIQRNLPTANPKTLSEEHDDQTIRLDGKNKAVTLKLSGRGIILVYAISFVIVIVAIGWVAVQLATAWRLVLTPLGPTIGLLTWALIALISALASR